VDLRSRNRKRQNAAFPEIVEALETQPSRDFIADGEIVAFEGDVTSFSRLQGRIGLRRAEDARASDVAVHLYLFDLLHLGGYDLRQLPLRRRKALLKRALRFDGRVRYTPHRNGAARPEWTEDGKLRHPRFLGLRSDKDPKQVHRERPRR
jgi:bifunctional non-homologous end joining protein LigD